MLLTINKRWKFCCFCSCKRQVETNWFFVKEELILFWIEVGFRIGSGEGTSTKCRYQINTKLLKKYFANYYLMASVFIYVTQYFVWIRRGESQIDTKLALRIITWLFLIFIVFFERTFIFDCQFVGSWLLTFSCLHTHNSTTQNAINSARSRKHVRTSWRLGRKRAISICHSQNLYSKGRPAIAGAVTTAAMLVIATIPNVGVGYEADCKVVPAEVISRVGDFFCW